MSKEDDAIIQAVGYAINEAGQGYLRDCADQHAGWADIPEIVFAKAAIAAYLDGLEKAGWKVVPKTWNEPMWKAWQESAGGGEIEFRHVIAASPTPPGAG